jgi:hypothetical protein
MGVKWYVALGAGALIAAMPAHAQVDVMQFADSDSDGKVTPAEYAAFSLQAWTYFTQDAEKVKPADIDPAGQALMKDVPRNADGFVTKAAFVASTEARFKKADKNGDGTLSSAELNASLAN